MFKVIIPNSVMKEIKKLEKRVVQKIITAIGEIAETPYTGKTLTGNLSSIRKWTIKDNGIQ